MSNLLEVVQDDIYQILKSVPGLAEVKIFANNEADIENKVSVALQTQQPGETGKIGLVVIVLLPELVNTDTNLPGPVVTVRQEIQIIEQVQLNRSLLPGSNGTGIRSSVAALRVLNALQLRTVANRTLYADPKNPVIPVPMKDKGQISHCVAMVVPTNTITGAERVAAIHPEIIEGGLLILTCATPDADIRYTTDGSYPSPTNPQAQIFSVPIAPVEVVTTFRAAAYAPNLNPGDCIEFIATPSTP